MLCLKDCKPQHHQSTEQVAVSGHLWRRGYAPEPDAFPKGLQVNEFTVAAAKIFGHIREGGLCWEWPLREELL